MVDNAIDQWARTGETTGLRIDVTIEQSQQSIVVRDNAGGVERDELTVMVTPGSSQGTGAEESIGLFGVGTKRAVVALAQHVRITTRCGNGKTYLIEYDDQWLQDDIWQLPIYEVDGISRSSTVIELSRLRFRIDDGDVARLREHLRATYALFLVREDITLALGGETLTPIDFENWAYPPEYRPRQFQGEMMPCSCAAARPRSICTAYSIALRTGNAPGARRSRRLPPSSGSETMHGVPSCVPTS